MASRKNAGPSNEGNTSHGTKDAPSSQDQLSTDEILQSPAFQRLVQQMEIVLRRVVQATNKAQFPQAFEEFRKMDPPILQEDSDPKKAKIWLRTIERIFNFLQITDDDFRLRIIPRYLQGNAANWWSSQQELFEPTDWTWTTFRTQFSKAFIDTDNSATKAQKTQQQATARTQDYSAPVNKDKTKASSNEDGSNLHQRRKRKGIQDSPPPLDILPLSAKVPEGSCHNCGTFGHPKQACPHPTFCRLCGIKGHIQTLCPHAICFLCHNPGHMQWHCPKKHCK